MVVVQPRKHPISRTLHGAADKQRLEASVRRAMRRALYTTDDPTPSGGFRGVVGGVRPHPAWRPSEKFGSTNFENSEDSRQHDYYC